MSRYEGCREGTSDKLIMILHGKGLLFQKEFIDEGLLFIKPREEFF